MRETVPPEASDALDRWLGRPDWVSERIAGDASARAYFRVTPASGPSRILAWYPEEIRGDIDRVVRAHDALRAHVPIPAILERSTSCLLQEDAGDRTLTALLAHDRDAALARYRDAVDLLVSLQQAGAARDVNPPFDAAKFLSELEMTLEFYVTALAGVGDAGRLDELRGAFSRLAERLARHPYLLCHRDYHGQNIHVLNDRIFVIDYQDLRMGPDTYDLASLLRDRGVWKAIGVADEELLLDRWAGHRGETDRAAFRRRYLESLLQRSIKAIGTFARMAVVYRRGHYLDYLAPTLETVRHCVGALGEWPEIAEHVPLEWNRV